MSKQSTPFTRSLILFAFVSDEYARTGDLTKSLMQLFRPIFDSHLGQELSVGQFASEVRDFYGFRVSQPLAYALVDRLEQHGHLTKVEQPDGSITLRFVGGAPRVSPITESEVTALVNAYIAFAEQELAKRRLTIDAEIAERHFYECLVRREFLTFFSRPEEGLDIKLQPRTTLTLHKELPEALQDHPAIESGAGAHLDFCVAEFLVKLYESDRKTFDIAVHASNGALLSEVVLSLQEPPEGGEHLSDLVVFLDGPLVMDFLHLGDPGRIQYSDELYGELRAAKVKLKIFSTHVSEIDETIKAVLRTIDGGKLPYGQLARLVATPGGLAYLRAVSQNLSRLIAEKEIEVDPASAIEKSERLKFFTESDEQGLTARLGLYGASDLTPARDAAAVAGVMRLRGDRPISPRLANCNAILLTRNAHVYEATYAFLEARQAATRGKPEAKRYRQGDVSPCITDKQIVGVLWLLLGSAGEALPRKRLIANCAAVAGANRAVTARMLAFLRNESQEHAELFAAVVTEERYECLLTRKVLGDPRLLVAENYREILTGVLEDIKDELKDEAQAEAVAASTENLAQERKEFTRQIASEAAARTELQTKVSELQKTIANSQQERAQDRLDRELEAEAQRAKAASAESEARQKDSQIRDLYSRNRAHALKVAKRVRVAFSLMLGLFAAFLTQLAAALAAGESFLSVIVSVVVGTAVVVISWWDHPKWMFRGLSRKAERWAVEDSLSGITLRELEQYQSIDWNTLR